MSAIIGTTVGAISAGKQAKRAGKEKARLEDKLKTFPHANKSIIKKRKHNFTSYEQDLIYWYHREDFIAGNYSKVP